MAIIRHVMGSYIPSDVNYLCEMINVLISPPLAEVYTGWDTQGLRIKWIYDLNRADSGCPTL